MIDTSKLNLRDKRLFSSFRLDQPLSASSNGAYIAGKWQEWSVLKKADIAKREEAEKYNQAHKYETRAGTKSIPADSSRGTF